MFNFIFLQLKLSDFSALHLFFRFLFYFILSLISYSKYFVPSSIFHSNILPLFFLSSFKFLLFLIYIFHFLFKFVSIILSISKPLFQFYLFLLFFLPIIFLFFLFPLSPIFFLFQFTSQ